MPAILGAPGAGAAGGTTPLAGNPRASHRAEDLPEVVGETSWTDQYLLDKRFHGQRDKLRKTAAVRNSAAKILEDAYWYSGTAWKTATANQQGETAAAVEQFFNLFVGKTPPPGEVVGEETLMANLPAACRMIANACEAYADHVETASKRIPEQSNPITGDTLLPWDRARFGGDGRDGGLHELVSDDMRIASLGKIPPAMDSSQARVPMPQPVGGGFLPPLPPFLVPLVRVPLLGELHRARSGELRPLAPGPGRASGQGRDLQHRVGHRGRYPGRAFPDVTRPRLVAAFIAHLEALGLD
ncbi:hypothetical protein [Streptomyces sp. NPDC006459]|uniref:hypothetical protein n=1 Tax=Streptomyces sp. NPDC006459 TaxID=3154303 RepID=UPI0033A665CF